MPTVTPSGPLSVNLDKLRTLLSTSTTFQARVGASSAAEALAKIHLVWFRPATDADREQLVAAHRPAAILMQGPQFSFAQYAGGDRNYLQPSGTFELLLTDNARFDDLENSELDFCNFVGGTLYDLAAAAAVSDAFSLTAINTKQPPTMNSDDNTQVTDRYHWASYLLAWGLGQL